MSYEVDYLSVGGGEKCGDAIALRFGNLAGAREEQTVVVIDGGFKESGEELVEHIQKYYNTNHVDIVVSTHPDSDHASGLEVVLEKLSVGQLLMHKPWDHSENIRDLFQRRVTASGIAARIEESLQDVNSLESLAARKGIEIVEPFQGTSNETGTVHVLGPSLEYYRLLLPRFRCTPEPVAALDCLGPSQKADEIRGVVQDHPDKDLLDDDEELASAENNSSAIILFSVDGHKLLFTGDAGKTALLQAANYARNRGVSLTDLRFLDVPHHGSKRNINTKVLSLITAQTAFVSGSKTGTKHPARKVTNALKKRQAKVFVNRPAAIRHHYNAPERKGWSAVQEEPFHNYVEE